MPGRLPETKAGYNGLVQPTETSMTKRQIISGFVVAFLIASAAITSTATWRSPAHAAVINGSLMIEDIKVDVNKLSTEDYEDMSLVFSNKTLIFRLGPMSNSVLPPLRTTTEGNHPASGCRHVHRLG
jgi:hypothetical protein